MARSFNRFLTKSWTDFPIEGSSPLLNQKISAFLLFNPFSTRCPNNSQPTVSHFYFLIFWSIFYGRCLNPLSVVAHFGCWPNEKFCKVSRMQLDFDSKKKKKLFLLTRYVLHSSFVFLCFICYINIFMIPYEDTKITSFYDPTFDRDLWQGDVYSGGRFFLLSIGFLCLLHFFL